MIFPPPESFNSLLSSAGKAFNQFSIFDTQVTPLWCV